MTDTQIPAVALDAFAERLRACAADEGMGLAEMMGLASEAAAAHGVDAETFYKAFAESHGDGFRIELVPAPPGP